MKASPYIEQIRVKSPGKKEEVLYCIDCNEYRMSDITEEQLTDIYSLIGEFLGKGGEQ